MAVITADESGNVLGDEGRNTLQGDNEDNYLDGYGGADCLFGNGGNDILIYDFTDRIISGGDGIDTLRLSGGGGFASLSGNPRVLGIEIIDLTGGSTLSFTANDVLRISDNDSFVIKTDLILSQGTVITVDPGAGWQYDGYSSDGQFLEFSQGGAHLSIDQGITIVGYADVSTSPLLTGDVI